MVPVSENFISLATAPGREVSCRIEAGDLTFDDSEILSFRFQDVAHAEEMTFGETAANRFHFELRTDRFIPLSAVIKPYVSFDGGKEECPLGVFYIAKRYRRRDRYSITCYDRMYRLENRYETELEYPAELSDLFAELCSSQEIDCDIQLPDMIIDSPPTGASCREVIGYAAGLCGAAAKFDRQGRLVFKYLDDCGVRLLRDNYKSLSLTQDPCEIKQVTVKTDTDSFSAGEGTRLTTYVQYNPFGNKRTADILYNRWKDFTYHGMEIEMQGLPYLEAGDRLTVQNDTDNGVFTGIISEIDYEYDGGLWATLYSKSKNPIDDSEPPKTEEEELEQAAKDLSVVYYAYESTKKLSAGTTPTYLFSMDIEAEQSTEALLFVQLQFTAEADCTLTMTVLQNDKALLPPYRITLNSGEEHPVCLHRFLRGIETGYTKVSLLAKTDGGYVTFPAGGVIATVSGQYLKADVLSRSPNRTICETVGVLGRRTDRKALFADNPVMVDVFAPIEFTLDDGLRPAKRRLRKAPIMTDSAEVRPIGSLTRNLTDIYRPARTVKRRATTRLWDAVQVE